MMKTVISVALWVAFYLTATPLSTVRTLILFIIAVALCTLNFIEGLDRNNADQ